MKRRGLILSVLALGVAGFGGAAWYATRPDPIAASDPIDPEMADALIRPYSPILGHEDAPVTIVEFFDPACEACRALRRRSSVSRLSAPSPLKGDTLRKLMRQCLSQNYTNHYHPPMR